MDCSPPGSCPWDFPGKNTGVGCHFLVQGIFLTQGLNLCLMHWQVGHHPPFGAWSALHGEDMTPSSLDFTPGIWFKSCLGLAEQLLFC